MMNVVALAFLASCFTGLLGVVVPPQPLQEHSVHGSHEAPGFLQTTADTFEGATDFVGDRFEAAKESTEDAHQHATVSMQETAEKAKHGLHETADMAASYIPGKHTKDGKERVASPQIAEESDLASYIIPGVGQTMESLKRKLDEEKNEISSFIEGSPAIDSLKKKAEQVYAYIPSAKQGEKSMEGVKKGGTEQVHGWQGKAHDMADDVVKNGGDTIGDVGELNLGKGEYRNKLGGIFHGLKEKLTKGSQQKGYEDGLDTKVHELCNWLGDGRRVEGSVRMGAKLDGDALHESYVYLMESALRAIDGAKEVFEAAIEGEGGEWKEKYSYLADSAKGALEGAKEVFNRAITTMGDDVRHGQEALGDHAKANPKDASIQKVPGCLMSHLKEAAMHAKHRLSAIIRSLVRTLYLASFSAVFGITVWITFFSGHLLSRALPRQQLAVVQSKIFPAYLRVITGCLAVCAIGHMVLHPGSSANWWESLQQWNFSFSLVISVCNTLLVEPKVTKIMFEKLKIEKEEGRGQSEDTIDKATMAPIDAKFKGLHQVASVANLAIVAGLTWHLWYLANRLVV